MYTSVFGNQIKYSLEESQFFEKVSRGEIPQSVPELLMERIYDPTSFRRLCLEHELMYYGMCCIISQDWIHEFVKCIRGSKILEVNSGGGWLASALHNEGVDITASDNMKFRTHNRFDGLISLLYPTLSLSIEDAISLYGKSHDILLTCWPEHDIWTRKACELWGYDKLVIYIGDGSSSGVHAGEEFFDYFQEFKSLPIVRPTRSSTFEQIYVGQFTRPKGSDIVTSLPECHNQIIANCIYKIITSIKGD